VATRPIASAKARRRPASFPRRGGT
jgi:hypothetical protein